jgi:hypothetical protein
VDPRDLACNARSAAERTAYLGRELFRLPSTSVSLHGPCSSKWGISPELSYTAQESASGLYTGSKFVQPRAK